MSLSSTQPRGKIYEEREREGKRKKKKKKEPDTDRYKHGVLNENPMAITFKTTKIE